MVVSVIERLVLFHVAAKSREISV